MPSFAPERAAAAFVEVEFCPVVECVLAFDQHPGDWPVQAFRFPDAFVCGGGLPFELSRVTIAYNRFTGMLCSECDGLFDTNGPLVPPVQQDDRAACLCQIDALLQVLIRSNFEDSAGPRARRWYQEQYQRCEPDEPFAGICIQIVDDSMRVQTFVSLAKAGVVARGICRLRRLRL